MKYYNQSKVINFIDKLTDEDAFDEELINAISRVVGQPIQTRKEARQAAVEIRRRRFNHKIKKLSW